MFQTGANGTIHVWMFFFYKILLNLMITALLRLLLKHPYICFLRISLSSFPYQFISFSPTNQKPKTPCCIQQNFLPQIRKGERLCSIFCKKTKQLKISKQKLPWQAGINSLFLKSIKFFFFCKVDLPIQLYNNQKQRNRLQFFIIFLTCYDQLVIGC